MAKSIYLQLTKPCTERWDKMIPTQQGAYCSSCNKQVIDLTAKTENEIYELVTQHNGEMCARLTKQQLNTPIRKSELVNGWFNWRAIAASLGALLAVEKAQASTSDSTTIAIHNPSRANAIEIDTLPVKPDILTGTVVDSATNEPLKYATAFIKDLHISTVTDSNGVFTIENASLYKDQTLQIRHLTHVDVEVAVNEFIPGSKIRMVWEYIDVSELGTVTYLYGNPFLDQGVGPPPPDLTAVPYYDRPRKNKKQRK
ncbi:MAG: hypothetical protein RLZZ367_784 [Bacteroidota bacterium]|jgi:hypothetical protein